MNWLMRRAASVSSNIINKGGSNIGPSGLRYRMGIVSDVHSGYSSYSYEANFDATLKSLKNRGAEFIISCGDQANGADSQWSSFVSYVNNAGFGIDNVYGTIGNHEYDNNNATSAYNKFNTYMGKNYLSGGSNVPYYCVMIDGDLFVFLVIEASSPNSVDTMSTAQLDWFESVLNEHYGKGYNIWVIEHAPFHGWGTGDIMSSPRYPRGMNMSFAGHKRLKSILEAHPDLIMCHGHTHIRFEDRDTWGVSIYAPPKDGGCHQFHVPSVCALKKVVSMSSEPSVISPSLGQSQCWVCDVYTDKIVMQGINSYTNTDIPDMTYTIQL